MMISKSYTFSFPIGPKCVYENPFEYFNPYPKALSKPIWANHMMLVCKNISFEDNMKISKTIKGPTYECAMLYEIAPILAPFKYPKKDKSGTRKKIKNVLHE